MGPYLEGLRSRLGHQCILLPGVRAIILNDRGEVLLRRRTDMRHPLCSSSIFLIIPGVAVAFRSWLLLPMPLVAYAAFRICLPAEDDDLRERYGEALLTCRVTPSRVMR